MADADIHADHATLTSALGDTTLDFDGERDIPAVSGARDR
jgi:hypothetical protein